MAESVSIQIFGDTYFRRRIQAMRYRSRDMSPVLNDIADDWVDIIEDQFNTEGARTGRKWKKLAIDTVMRRGSAHPILIDSADMMMHVTDRENVEVTDDSVVMTFGGSPEIKARAEAHQHGFINALTHRPVPARPIVDFTELDEVRMRNKIQDYLVTGDRSK